MRLLVLFILLGVTLFGCIEETPSPPKNVLNKEEMIDVMEEVQLIEALRQRGVVLPKDMSPEEEAKRLYVRLFDKHGITRKQFEESYTWYEENPGILAEVYDSVHVRLSQRQAEVRNPSPADQAADSVSTSNDTLKKPE